MTKFLAGALALTALVAPAYAQSSAAAARMSKGIEAYNAQPQVYWVYIKDKGGIVAMYPPEGTTLEGRTWATTDQFEQLISSPADAAAGPTIVNSGVNPGRVPSPNCVGPYCPSDAALARLRGLPDFPAGNLLLRGTAVHAVFFERQ